MKKSNILFFIGGLGGSCLVTIIVDSINNVD